MAISGTIPHFHHGLSPMHGTPTVVTVTGTDTGIATGTHASESLAAFYKRSQVALGGISGAQLLSGTLSGISGGVSGTVYTQNGSVYLTSAQLSGIRAMQREVAMRAADLSHSFKANGPRLTEAQRFLALSGGEIKGL